VILVKVIINKNTSLLPDNLTNISLYYVPISYQFLRYI